jgi:branched-chain amino acid transport system permease protein
VVTLLKELLQSTLPLFTSNSSQLEAVLVGALFIFILQKARAGIVPLVLRRLPRRRPPAPPPAEPLPRRPAVPKGAALLALDGVTKRFGGLVAVSEVSLAVPVGCIHGLIGPNGAGKSTTIGLIAGFLRADTGRITFGTHDLGRLAPAQIARLGISRTFQQATPLAGLSVFENVLVGMHTRYRAGLGAVLLPMAPARREAAAIEEAARALLATFGLEAQADADARNLTFGQLRFLEIARAIAMRPRILLLDEPAAGLNDGERARLATLIRGFRDEGVGMLLVDHDVPFVFALCDRMTVMNFGSVIAAGDPDAVHRDPAVREAYLGAEPAGAGAD